MSIDVITQRDHLGGIASRMVQNLLDCCIEQIVPPVQVWNGISSAQFPCLSIKHTIARLKAASGVEPMRLAAAAANGYDAFARYKKGPPIGDTFQLSFKND